jgi:hypothetical protein
MQETAHQRLWITSLELQVFCGGVSSSQREHGCRTITAQETLNGQAFILSGLSS